MLLHNRCGTPVVGDLSSQFKLLVSFAITKKGMRVNIGDIIINDGANKVAFSDFYCEVCKEKVEEKDVILRCYHCGVVLTIDTAHIPSNGGGIYCEEHIGLFGSEDSIPLRSVFSKVYF